MNKAVANALELTGPPVAIAARDLQAEAPTVGPPPVYAVTDGPSLRRGLQALFQRAGPGTLDLGGCEIVLQAPIDMPLGLRVPTAHRRVIRNGRILCRAGSDWAPVTQLSDASYTPSNPKVLSNVTGIASIPVGALVEGTGVGREVYVTARRLDAAELILSQPLWGAAANQSYSFTRFRHALDLSGVGGPCDLGFADLVLECNGIASGLSLPCGATSIYLDRCDFDAIADRGVTSFGSACQSFRMTGGRVRGTGLDMVAVTVSSDAATIRGVQAEAPMVLHGQSHMVEGCDLAGGVVLTAAMSSALLTGNRFKGAGVEVTDECSGADVASLGGLSVTGNHFSATDPAPGFRWIMLRPHRADRPLSRLSVTGNTFIATGTNARRVEGIDTRHADPDHVRTRSVTFQGNVIEGVDQPAMNPVTLEFEQATSATTWTLNVGDHLPFGGHARTVTGVVPNGPIRSGDEMPEHAMPIVRGNAGSRHRYVRLVWPVPCHGKVFVTTRIDRPT